MDNRLFRPARALILDFDGTILDTESLEFRAWQEVYAAHGQELPFALWADSIGRGPNDVKFDALAYLVTLAGDAVESARVTASRRARLAEMIADEPIRPGIMEYLEAARVLDLKIGVASSSKHDWVDGHLSRLGILSQFDITRCADDVTFAKPSPDLYYLTCGSLGAAPDETVVVEDSPNGLRAAVRAGTFAIAFPNPLTSHLDLSHATLQIEDLRARPLPSVLEIMAHTRKNN